MAVTNEDWDDLKSKETQGKIDYLLWRLQELDKRISKLEKKLGD